MQIDYIYTTMITHLAMMTEHPCDRQPDRQNCHEVLHYTIQIL